MLTALVVALALGIEDDFLDDAARCHARADATELYGPLRVGNSRSWLGNAEGACLRTEVDLAASLDAHRDWNTALHWSYRTRKRAETFGSFELSHDREPLGAVRWGIALQAPLDPDVPQVAFSAQLMLPTFGTQRRTGSALGLDVQTGGINLGLHLHLSATAGFVEQDDGRWVYGSAFDVALGAAFAPVRFVSLIAEARGTAGNFAPHGFRVAMGARFTFGALGFELSVLTPQVGSPAGFEGTFSLRVLPFERLERPRFHRDYYSDDYG